MGERCIERFFEHLGYRFRDSGVKHLNLWFHNVAYDIGVIGGKMKVMKDLVRKNGKLYSLGTNYRGVEMMLKDSYKIIDSALSQFHKMFGTPNKKEAIPYKYYTLQNIANNDLIHLNYFKSFFEMQEDKNKFDIIILEEASKPPASRNYTIQGNLISPLEYYLYYHKFDCLILEEGMETLNTRLKTFSNENLNVDESVLNFLTISSYSDHLASVYVCYDGIYTLSGNIRSFVEQAIRGGINYVNPL